MERPDVFGMPTRAVREHRTLLDVLGLEEIDRDIYRAGFLADEALALYGGQVAAQALLAAGRTVPDDRAPHSMHGYFLRAGDPARPTVLRVHRDRDGRSYSARRVEALQDGEVIFSMAASFHVAEDGVDIQSVPAPEAPDPGASEPFSMPRLISMEGRRIVHHGRDGGWPTLFWARSTVGLGADPLLNACALTYLSDLSSGLAPMADDEGVPGSSLDHAVWFHRPASLDEWVLVELIPRSVAAGRGWYVGAIYDLHGAAVASIAQESLFRRRALRPAAEA